MTGDLIALKSITEEADYSHFAILNANLTFIRTCNFTHLLASPIFYWLILSLVDSIHLLSPVPSFDSGIRL